jgi:RNA polymerase sigma factor (sigma-70 family)
MAVFKHRESLLEYIGRHLPAQISSLLDPQDVLQDVYIDALAAKVDWLVLEEKVITRKLKTIARHNILDLIKAYRRAKRGGGCVSSSTDLGSKENLLSQLSLYERTPSASALSHEKHNLVRTAIDSLPPEQAKALRLRYLAGMSWQAVGEATSRTRDAAEQLCRRAIIEARQRLNPSSLGFHRSSRQSTPRFKP